MSEEGHKNLDIGRILRRGREERGLTLEDVEEATRIRARYLEGLEQGDYESLPAAVYVRGFLKTYANYLDLDGDELAAELRRRQVPSPGEHRLYEPPQEKDPDDLPEPTVPALSGALQAAGRLVPVLTLSILVLAALIFTLYFIGKGSQSAQNIPDPPAKKANAESKIKDGSAKDGKAGANANDANDGAEANAGTDESANTATRANDASDAGSGGEPGGEEPAPDSGDAPSSQLEIGGGTDPTEPPTGEQSGTLQARFTVTEEPASWLEVETDGEMVFADLAEPGFSRTFEARREIRVTAGYAGSVKVELNGQDAGFLGEGGEVVTRRPFTLKQASGS